MDGHVVNVRSERGLGPSVLQDPGPTLSSGTLSRQLVQIYMDHGFSQRHKEQVQDLIHLDFKTLI